MTLCMTERYDRITSTTLCITDVTHCITERDILELPLGPVGLLGMRFLLVLVLLSPGIVLRFDDSLPIFLSALAF